MITTDNTNFRSITIRLLALLAIGALGMALFQPFIPAPVETQWSIVAAAIVINLITSAWMIKLAHDGQAAANAIEPLPSNKQITELTLAVTGTALISYTTEAANELDIDTADDHDPREPTDRNQIATGLTVAVTGTALITYTSSSEDATDALRVDTEDDNDT